MVFMKALFLFTISLTLSLWGLEIKSPVFDNGGIIPKTYTCDGRNINPPLLWKDIPKGTKSLVLIVHDPDAPIGDFTHWLVYKIPPSVKGLPEGLPRKPILKHGIEQGLNDFGFVGYGGPCPPLGTDTTATFLSSTHWTMFQNLSPPLRVGRSKRPLKGT